MPMDNLSVVRQTGSPEVLQGDFMPLRVDGGQLNDSLEEEPLSPVHNGHSTEQPPADLNDSLTFEDLSDSLLCEADSLNLSCNGDLAPPPAKQSKSLASSLEKESPKVSPADVQAKGKSPLQLKSDPTASQNANGPKKVPVFGKRKRHPRPSPKPPSIYVVDVDAPDDVSNEQTLSGDGNAAEKLPQDDKNGAKTSARPNVSSTTNGGGTAEKVNKAEAKRPAVPSAATASGGDSAKQISKVSKAKKPSASTTNDENTASQVEEDGPGPSKKQKVSAKPTAGTVVVAVNPCTFTPPTVIKINRKASTSEEKAAEQERKRIMKEARERDREQKRLQQERKKIERAILKQEREKEKEQKRIEIENRKEQRRLVAEQRKAEMEQKRIERELKKATTAGKKKGKNGAKKNSAEGPSPEAGAKEPPAPENEAMETETAALGAEPQSIGAVVGSMETSSTSSPESAKSEANLKASELEINTSICKDSPKNPPFTVLVSSEMQHQEGVKKDDDQEEITFFPPLSPIPSPNIGVTGMAARRLSISGSGGNSGSGGSSGNVNKNNNIPSAPALKTPVITYSKPAPAKRAKVITAAGKAGATGKSPVLDKGKGPASSSRPNIKKGQCPRPDDSNSASQMTEDSSQATESMSSQLTQTEPSQSMEEGSSQLTPMETSQTTEKQAGSKLKRAASEELDNVNSPVWIQCADINCHKWRRVKEYDEPSQVPDGWRCRMNMDEEHNSCTAPQEPWDVESNEEFVETVFVPGTIVWGKMDTYPWWPAMIEPDPEMKTYYQMGLYTSKPVRYHVVYFDTPTSRSWLQARSIMLFTSVSDANKAVKCKVNPKYKRILRNSIKEATKALTMTRKERLVAYSFIKRQKKEKQARRNQLMQAARYGIDDYVDDLTDDDEDEYIPPGRGTSQLFEAGQSSPPSEGVHKNTAGLSSPVNKSEAGPSTPPRED